MHGILVRNKERDLQRYGNFYILNITKYSWMPNKLYKFALVAEDFSWLDCNGNTNDVPIAYAIDKNELIVWSACNGIDLVDTKTHAKLRRTLFFD